MCNVPDDVWMWIENTLEENHVLPTGHLDYEGRQVRAWRDAQPTAPEPTVPDSVLQAATALENSARRLLEQDAFAANYLVHVLEWIRGLDDAQPREGQDDADE